MKHAVSKITVNELTHNQLALIKNLQRLLDFRSGNINIDGFTIDHVNNLIVYIYIYIQDNIICIYIILFNRYEQEIVHYGCIYVCV